MSETNVQAEPTYRQATINDADAIASVIAEVVKEPNPVAFERALDARRGAHLDHAAWAARAAPSSRIIDGKVVGFARSTSTRFEPDTVILGVWLLPETRRKGIGTSLAEYALGFARDKGYKRIRGRLPQNNEIALSVPEQHRRAGAHLQPGGSVRAAAGVTSVQRDRDDGS